MADFMLRDSPIPDAEEEGERRQEEIPTGKPIVPFPLNFGFSSCCWFFLTRDFSPDSHNQENSVASLVVGAKTSVAPSASAPPQVDRIKLAQEHVGLVQKLL